jgi:hypothetical protein
MMGNVFRVKLVQFSLPVIECTLMIKSTLKPLRVLKHGVTARASSGEGGIDESMEIEGCGG